MPLFSQLFNARNFVFLISLFLGAFSWAQEEEMQWQNNPDHTLGAKVGFSVPSLTFDIQDTKKQFTPIKYSPMSPTRIFLALSYGSFGVTGGVNSSINSDDQIRYGNSSTTDFQFHFFLTKMTFDLFYQNYSGYYIQNSAEINPALPANSPRIQRPDINTKAYGLQWYYLLSPDRYSQGAAFEHNRRQLQSGGSWYLLTTAMQASVSASSPLIPSQLTSTYGQSAQFSSGDFNTIKFGVGYGYNLIFSKVYLSMLLGLAGGQQQQIYKLLSTDNNQWVPVSGLNAKIGIGYNGDKYFGGFQYFADATSIPMEDSQISISTLEVRVFWGARFFDLPLPWLDRWDQALFGNTVTVQN